MPPAVFLLVADEPLDRGRQTGVFPEPEAEHHPHRVSGDAHLAPAASQLAGRQEPMADQEVHPLRDARVLPGEPQVGEDEEPPVRRDILRAIQLQGRRPARGPLAFRVLFTKDPRGPALPPDLLLRTDEGGVVLRTIEEVPQDPEPHARIRVLREQPVPKSATQGHRVPAHPPALYVLRNLRAASWRHSLEPYVQSRFDGRPALAQPGQSG